MEYSDPEPRLWYIREIITRLGNNEVFSPTAAQERSYKEALAHVARIISKERNEPPCRTGAKPKKKKPSRKELLRGVLRVLHAMEHKRIYDPPGHSEIGYYLIIRKYIRSCLTFFGSEIKPEFQENSTCFALIKGLHHLEELAELPRHLACFSASVSELNIRNGYTPLMGIKNSHGVPPVIPGSRERNSAFYCHKFILAFFDLRSHSLLLCSPPSSVEKIAYLQALDCTQECPSELHLVTFSEEEDVYSDYLRYLLIERIRVDVNDLEMHCASITSNILRKLSMSESWDILYNKCDGDIDIRETAKEVSRDLVEKCKVSVKDLPAYILDVEHGIRLARQTEYFLSGLFHDNYRFIEFLQHSECFERPTKIKPSHQGSFKQGWVALHALTILNYGSSETFGELSALNNPMVQAPSEKENETERSEPDENVKNLQGIIDDFKCIGDSNIIPDDEEIQFLHKIWQSVASAIEFFISALAYEQQQCVSKGVSLPTATEDFINLVRRHGLRTAEECENDFNSLCELDEKFWELSGNLECLREILHAYKECLLERR